MSVYTTEVRFICETFAGLKESKGYPDVDNIINQAIPKIFQQYPIYDESYRNVLNHKILLHYYTREIGYETVGLWLLKLNQRLNEIMPYYNKLYEIMSIKYNPLHDVDIKKEHQGTIESDGQSSKTQDTESKGNQQTQFSSSSEAARVGGDNSKTTESGTEDRTEERDRTYTSRNKFSDTPQGSLSGVENGTYLTDYRKLEDGEEIADAIKAAQERTSQTDSTISDNSNSKSTGATTGQTTDSSTQNQKINTENNTTENWLESIVGKQGTQSYTSMIVEYRNALINIDMMIIDQLADLFMNLW